MAGRSRGSYPPVTRADLDALRRYADKHGRRWKHRLWVDWMNASAEPTLHGLRNSHGPTWLEQFRWPNPVPAGPGDAAAAQRVLDVSGGHLTASTWAWLDDQTADDVVRDPVNHAYAILGGRTRQGWFLRAEEVLDSTVPSDLADVLSYTRRSGCSFVMLDRDCIPLADLPVLHPEFQDAKPRV